MKQFLVCLLLSILTHFLFSVGGSGLNPFEWITDVKIPYVIIVLVIWIFPIVINYLDGNENFKN
jgi:hypothetical protein